MKPIRFVAAFLMFTAAQTGFCAEPAAVPPAAPVAPVAQAPRSQLVLTEFRAGSFNVFQNSGGRSHSAYLGWTPEYYLKDWVSLQFTLGTSLLNTYQMTYIPIIQTALSLAFEYKNFRLEAGGGTQSWLSSDGTFPLVQGNLVWQLEKPLWVVLDRVIAGYSNVIATNSTHQVFVGVGFNFGNKSKN